MGRRHVLLLGAGFSRNWGGWLASEATDYLLGCREVQGSAELRRTLLKHNNGGGFEAALGEMQSRYRQSPSVESKHQVDHLQRSISEMFSAMDSAYRDRPFEFQNDIRFTVSTFLTKFDAIFTLNQDYLLERHYLNDNVMLGSSGRWVGWQIPGMVRVADPTRTPMDPAPLVWKPDSSGFRLHERYQPYFKLHGSSNWVTDDGDQLMILGSDKATQIQGAEILRWSVERLKDYLNGPTAVMVIGYGFRDDHINQILLESATRGELRLFIIDTLGIKALDQNNKTRTASIYVPSDIDQVLSPFLIGASSRRLSETFSNDIAEHTKVMRFFNP